MKNKLILTITVIILLLLPLIRTANAAFNPQINITSSNQLSDSDKENWVVIICAGANDNISEGKVGAESIRATSKHVYDTFKQLGYDDEHIFYLHDRNSSAEGADGVVSKSMIEYAITDWLNGNLDSNDNCCIFYNGHGGRNVIGIWNYVNDSSEIINDYEFASWIGILEYNVLTIVIDACFSGTFIDELSGENRILLTSSSPYFPMVGLYELVFSYYFCNKLIENVSYGKAWEYADKQIARMKITEDLLSNEGIILTILAKISMFLQNPQINDNNDKKGHGTFFANKLPVKGDGILALITYPS